jgi:hypothetical protein
MPFPFTKCQFCDYKTDVKCNLIRHQNAKHKDKICVKTSILEDVQNVPPNVQNVPPNVQNVPPNVQNVPLCILSCSKCNKIYKTARHLNNHEKVCNKVDSLTCPRCMISFTNRKHKSRHIKADKCKARSIIHARTPNIQNITNIENQTINNINNQINNNIIINNFGRERIDHISDRDIHKMLISGANTIPLYIEKKHFDKNFPENNNITFTNENKCKVLEDNIWKEKDLGVISSKLVHDNTEVLLLHCEDNEVELSNCIENKEVFDHITDKLIIIYNKSDAKKYNEVLSKIKELVKNNKIS